jgi:hypothetical protein
MRALWFSTFTQRLDDHIVGKSSIVSRLPYQISYRVSAPIDKIIIGIDIAVKTFP